MKQKQIILIGVFILISVVVSSFQKIIAKTNEVAPSAHLHITNQIIHPILTNDVDVPTSPAGREQQAKYEAMFRTPINFYGKVVDENSNPIADAEVEYSVGDRPYKSTNYQGRSDRNGNFSLTGIVGFGLDINVTKEGYYTVEESDHSIQYSGATPEMLPSPEKPMIFILREKGVSESLIFLKEKILVPKDGQPVEVNFRKDNPPKGVSEGQGDIIVQCWTFDYNRNSVRPYDWRFRLTGPSGGITERTNKFDFMAPEKNYQPYYEINMPKNLGKDWDSSVEKEFFLKLKDGNYVRIEIEMITGADHALWINSLLNPSGSRNLEFDETKQINN